MSYKVRNSDLYIDNIAEFQRHLAHLCKCDLQNIAVRFVGVNDSKRMKPGYYFFGPKDEIIAALVWEKGKYSDLLYNDEKIIQVRKYSELKRAALAARKKSVNYKGQDRKTEVGYDIGYPNGSNKVYMKKLAIKYLAITASIIVAINSAMMWKDILNPEFANDSYDSARQIVSLETHRTQSNDAYWYDYSGMASMYDAETMDFDSYVYGVFSKLGWNNESKIDCMNDFFRALKNRGITSYDSFTRYCFAKGVCVVKDGDYVVDMNLYRETMEEYMISLNNLEELGNDDDYVRGGKK